MTAVNILTFVLALMVLILVHEAGHMVAAKWCGMRVERFSIFFGRPIARFRRGETEYGIGWLPLGGYVSITGMTRGSIPPEELTPELEARAYYAAPTWKKVVTIAAGPAVNVVVALLAFTIYFWAGAPTPELRVGQVQAGSPAAAIGLQPGDRILGVNQVRVTGPDIEGARPVIEELRSSPGEVVALRYQRGEEVVSRRVRTLAVQDAGQRIGRIGIQWEQVPGPRESSGAAGGVADSGRYAWFLVEENAKAFGRVFTDEEAREQVGTIIGAGQVYNEVADGGALEALRFFGIISLVLAVFNLLPLFPLDGGHILFAVIEGVRGKPISRKVYERSALVGWAVIAVVFIVALQNDIVRLNEGLPR